MLLKYLWFGDRDARCSVWNLCLCPIVCPLACLQKSPCCCLCCAIVPSATACYEGPKPEVIERLVEPR